MKQEKDYWLDKDGFLNMGPGTWVDESGNKLSAVFCSKKEASRIFDQEYHREKLNEFCRTLAEIEEKKTEIIKVLFPLSDLDTRLEGKKEMLWKIAAGKYKLKDLNKMILEEFSP